MLTGLAPIIGKRPEILILGSMPSQSSLQKQQYYGHPRNAFWPLLARLLGVELTKDYDANVNFAIQNKVAIWDVIAQCERQGSLDSAIIKGTETLNPIIELLDNTPSIRAIGLNGGLAATLFSRHCRPYFDLASGVISHTLPSTSPANARINFDAKCKAWKVLFAPLYSTVIRRND